MTNHNEPYDEELPIPELSRLREIHLRAEDRHELWQSLESRMNHETKQQPRRTRRRFLWSAATVAAAVIGLVVAYDSLPIFQTHSPTAPTAEQPAKPAPVEQQPLSAQAQQDLVREVMSLAGLGKVRNCPFAADRDLIDSVKQAWGEPDRQDVVGHGLYATYEKRNYAFGFNKGNQIFDVRTYAPEIKQIELQSVTSVLGKPDHINTYSDPTTPEQEIYVYQAGESFELQLVFPKVTEQQPNPLLDHISVYCPKDALNNTAQ
nr:YjgB family protein [Tumebacillus amylolyticus]